MIYLMQVTAIYCYPPTHGRGFRAFAKAQHNSRSTWVVKFGKLRWFSGTRPIFQREPGSKCGLESERERGEMRIASRELSGNLGGIWILPSFLSFKEKTFVGDTGVPRWDMEVERGT